MKTATIYIDSRYHIGEIDRRVFGGFAEHLGRSVYDGIYQPGHPHSDHDGLRTDLRAALEGLNISVVRYPGGNFVSGYNWLNGVGPRERRPIVRDLAWQSIESNQFGTDEFMKLCGKLGWDPMITVNLGTGTPEEARNWIEYCNSDVGTVYADMRAANGHESPYGVRLWCLGNEMDAPWQLGHTPAEPYAIKAEQAGRMMKTVDDGIELVVCGSCLPSMKTYMDWDRTVLEYAGDIADYIGFHRYVGEEDEPLSDYLAVSASVDQQIEEMNAVCRYVQAKRRTKRRAYLCFDEWNVWYKNQDKRGGWTHAPHLLEERYDLADALVVGSFLLSFIRHADVLKIANIAQLVNVIAPIITDDEHILRQSIYWPFAMVSAAGRGTALRTVYEGSSYVSDRYGEVPEVDHAAVLEEDRINVFLINRSPDKPTDVRINIQGAVETVTAQMITGPSHAAQNTWDEPELIQPLGFTDLSLREGVLTMKMPPLSMVHACVRLG